MGSPARRAWAVESGGGAASTVDLLAVVYDFFMVGFLV
jgi:hypothetical protein